MFKFCVFILALTFFITFPTKISGQNPLPYVENEYIRIWPERIYPGIIDLFAKKLDGTWYQYNNIVPIAKVNDIWANSELDQSHITATVINQTNPVIVKYDYQPLSNGSHFYLLLTLNPGIKDARFEVKVEPDSTPITAFSLGNYYGLADLIRYVKHDSTIEDALVFPRPSGGNYQLGDFYFFVLPQTSLFRFSGESGFIQKQWFENGFTDLDSLVVEVRYTPWLPDQTPPNRNWFETVHLTREPFTSEKSVWHFGYEQSIVGDNDLSGDVDIQDMLNLTKSYTQNGCDYLIDNNQDCTVNIFDFNNIVKSYGLVAE